MTNEDDKLVRQALGGDRKAFTMLVLKYEKPIYNLAYRMAQNAEDAADITQTTFVKAYLRLDSFNPAHKFFSWLYRIAVNESLNQIERRRRAQTFHYDPPQSGPNPDEELEHKESCAHLARALAAMTLEQRVVIILKHLLLLPYREIAEILDISEKTVKSRLFTARHILRDQLVKQGYPR
jgi:RNA polymerase sigma-70 factor, ECF subfamily